MHRRHQKSNIPIEVLRSVVAVADFGSFNKAAERLELSQAAISAQIRRFESIIGASAFERGSGGVKLTELGNLALVSARRILESNDQIFRLGAGDNEVVALRIGLSVSYSDAFMDAWAHRKAGEPLKLYCDHSAKIRKEFFDGNIDVACVIGAFEGTVEPVVSWYEEFVWTRGRDFILSPGAPIPLIDWPGSLSNETAIRALERAGLGYRFVLRSADFYATAKAASIGLGLLALPVPLAVAPLIIAKEYYLPSLAPVRAGIYVRDGVAPDRVEPAVQLLRFLQRAETRAVANSR